MWFDRLIKGSKLGGYLLKLVGVVEASDANIDHLNIKIAELCVKIDRLVGLREEQPEGGEDIGMLGSVTCDMGNKVVEIFGGPYLSKPKDAIGIKLAAEIDAPSHLALDIEDFQVPTKVNAEKVVLKALVLLDAHSIIYAGCMGGVGRTGLFLALMVKVLKNTTGADAIEVVREHFNPHAIETAAQESFVKEFAVDYLVDFIAEYELFK